MALDYILNIKGMLIIYYYLLFIIYSVDCNIHKDNDFFLVYLNICHYKYFLSSFTLPLS